MKKIITLSLIGLFAFNVASAQDGEVLKNKNGVAMLPAAGDWGLGFNATPLLNYAGNMLGSSGNNSMSAAWAGDDNVLFGKYFKDANTAYRGQLRIGMKSEKEDDTSLGAFNNTKTTSESNVAIGVGLEKRRGHGKIQGYYGGDVMIGLNSKKETMEYADTTGAYEAPGWTMTPEKGVSNQFDFKLMGVVGVEYFILPKLSLGAEYSWGLHYQSMGQLTTTTVNASGSTVSNSQDKSSTLNLDTDNMSGKIRLMFYF